MDWSVLALLLTFPHSQFPPVLYSTDWKNYFEGRVFLPRAVLLSWWLPVVCLRVALDCFSRGSHAEKS